MFDKQPKCALIMAPCPKTADETQPVYCPNWVNNVPEVIKDGSGNITAEVFYTGCQLRRQVLYLLSMTASSGQAAASADKSATEARNCRKTLMMVISPEMHALVEHELKEIPDSIAV
jgi:hypothetical protein